jgi:hypothetical protein
MSHPTKKDETKVFWTKKTNGHQTLKLPVITNFLLTRQEMLFGSNFI